MRVRMHKALFAASAMVAIAAFSVPVRTEEFGFCGPAGLGVVGLFGDPTGPTDPPGTYAEYNACRLAARPWVILMLAALGVAAFAGHRWLRDRRQRQGIRDGSNWVDWQSAP